MRLGDVCGVVHGKNQKAVANPEGPYPIYGSGGIMGWADEFICPANTVIIGRKGTINKPIYVHEPCWNVDTAFGLVADQAKLHSRYLFHFCKRFDFESLSTTSAIPSLTSKNIERIQLRLPDLEVQRACASRLDVCLQQESLCDALAVKLDTLVKSRFVEMFGNRASGEIVALRDCCSSIVGGKTPSMKHPEYYGGGIPFIKSGDVIGDRVFGGALSLSDVALEHASVKMIPAGSVLVVTRSARLRKEVHCAVCASDVAINQDIKAFTPLPEFTSDYLLWAIRSHEPDLLKTVRSVSTSGMDLGTLFGIGIRKAPLSLQQQFAAFVQQADKLRFEQLVALKKRGSQHLIAP